MIEAVKKKMNKRGGTESEYSLEIVLMVIIIVVVMSVIGVLYFKGEAAVQFISRLFRGG